MAHHSQTLVVDFDDTLAITFNRDWENAYPNLPLIDRLNKLYLEGWDIHVVTARGNISCGGDHEAADRKYRSQIESWLSKHNVSYTSLSFQKKLAVYYIDDKGITPEDFLNKFSRVELKGGMSGSSVYHDLASNSVIKIAKNTASAVEWYQFAKKYVNVPELYSVIGDTIKMERLFPFEGSIHDVLYQLKIFSQLRPLHVGLLPYRYVDRCLHRIEKELTNEVDIKLLRIVIEYATTQTPISFSHGDFSISNIMSGKSLASVYLIDPINDPTLLSSWVIDLAKLYMSIGFEFSDDDPRREVIEQYAYLNKVHLEVLSAHEIGHYCRVYPYADEDKQKAILNKIKEKLRAFKVQIIEDDIDTITKMNQNVS